MSLVLSSVFGLPVVDVIGFCACYFFIVIFYLLAFAKTMLKLSGRVFGRDPLDYIRCAVDVARTAHVGTKNVRPCPRFIIFDTSDSRSTPLPPLTPRSNLDWLETRAYLAVYLVLFGLKLAGSLGIAIYFFYRDILNINKPKAGVDVSNAALPVAIVFFMLQIGSILVFAVFLLVEAFRIKTVEVGSRGCCPGARP
jgi:hypothetical protein